MKRYFILGSVVLGAILIVGGSFLFFPPKKAGQNEDEQFVEDKLGKNQVKKCDEKGTTFTHDFTDTTLINHVGVLGSITAGSRGRSYVSVKKDASGGNTKVPLYAPADATLKQIYFMNKGYAGSDGRPEYRLEFEINCDVDFFFDHIAEVEAKIKDVSPKVPADNSYTGIDVDIDFKAGELIGHTDGTGAGTWDFSVMSESADIYHINPKRWEWAQNTKAVCPYDYYTEELKTKYYNLLAFAFGEKSTDCGSPSHDVDDTLSGGWFQDDSTDTKGAKLLVGPTGKAVELSLSKDDGEPFRIRTFIPSKKPKDVKIGESVCYFDSDNNNYAYLTLINKSTVHAATGSGPCPSSLPSTYEVWKR